MRTSRTSKTRRISALLLTTILAAGYAQGALAQVAGQGAPPPVRQPLDENGVDVARGSFVTDIAQVSIGGTQGLSYAISSDGVTTAFGTIEQSGSTLIVTVDGRSDSFTISGSTFVSTEGNGATLILTSGTYTYTSSNGLRAVFASNSGYPYPFYEGEAGRLGGISYPDGSGRTFTFRVTTFCPAGYENGVCQAELYYVGRLQSVQSSHGYQLKFAYAFNDTTSNKVSDINYDSWGRVTSVTAINNAVEYCDPTASTCSLTGNWPKLTFAGSPATSVTDSLNRTTTFSPTAVTRPGGSSITATIDSGTGRVQSVTNAGVNYSYAYVDAGTVRTTTVTDPTSGQRVYTVDLTKVRITSYKDELNRTTAYAYDANGRTTEVTYPEGNKVQYTYDARGNVTQTRAISKTPGTPPDIVTSASFDATCANFKTCNKSNSRTDAKGNATDYTYDAAHGGLLTVTAPAATGGGIRPQTRYTYASRTVYSKPSSAGAPAAGAIIPLPVAISTCQTLASCAGGADEVKTTIDYGPQVAGTGNNLLPVTVSSGSGDGALSATVSATYDSTGNRLTIDGPLSGTADTTRTRYDASRQVVGVVGPDPDGGGALKHRAERFTYNLDGQVTVSERGTVNSQSDPDWAAFATAEAVTATYDTNARKLKDVLSSGGTSYSVSQYSYDALGRPDCTAQRMNLAIFGSLPASACTIGAAGSGASDFGPDRIVKNSYNAASQVTQVLSAYGTADVTAEVTNFFTANGKVQHVVDGNGNATRFDYDGHDRQVATVYPSSTIPGDTNPADYEAFTYDANGNVTQRRLRDGTSINYGFDNLNRIVSKDVPNVAPYEYDVSYNYDLVGRLKQALDSNTHVTNFTYDALNRKLSEQSNWTTRSYQYDIAGRRTRLTWGDGFYVAYGYDTTGNLLTIGENGATSGTGLLATYSYDNLGHRSSLTYGNGVVQSYVYDAVSRLQTLTSNLAGSAQDQSATFGYNPASQIDTLSKTNDAYAWNGHYNIDRTYAKNGLNQLTSAGATALTYDTRGNLTQSGSNAYTYTSENRMVTGGGYILSYDPLGRFHWASNGNPFNWMQYDGTDVIEERTSAGITRRYVHGVGSDAPLVWYEGSGTTDKRWLTADERGSIVAVTNSSGNAMQINTYDEYGIPAATNLGRFQYTGQAWLPEIGMYYYKARIYSPTLGRFMQTDPIGYGDGMNLYNYVGSDPVNGVDPSGLCEAVWEHRYYQNAQGVHRSDRIYFRGFANCNVGGTGGFSAGDRAGGGSGGGSGGVSGGGGETAKPQCPLTSLKSTNWKPDANGAKMSFSPKFAKIVDTAFNSLRGKGITPIVTQGFRTAADQAGMRSGGSGSNPAAKYSDHQLGNAIDISGTRSSYFPTIIEAFNDAGALWGGNYANKKDPPHFYIRPVNADAKNTAQCEKEYGQ